MKTYLVLLLVVLAVLAMTFLLASPGGTPQAPGVDQTASAQS